MFLQLFLLILPSYAMMCAGNAGGKGKYLVSDVTAAHTASEDSIMRDISGVVESSDHKVIARYGSNRSKIGERAT